ncbi:MAG: Rieske 2Fe-2S domain-containing protein [Candidatus Micrarchaeaceae archaeon]
MAWNTVVKADELAEGKRMTHILREDGVEKPIILTNKNGNFYAVSAVCSHKDGYLPNGQSDGSCIICPFHGGKFDLCTGKSMVKINPAKAPPDGTIPDLETHETKIEDGMVKVLFKARSTE